MERNLADRSPDPVRLQTRTEAVGKGVYLISPAWIPRVRAGMFVSPGRSGGVYYVVGETYALFTIQGPSSGREHPILEVEA